MGGCAVAVWSRGGTCAGAFGSPSTPCPIGPLPCCGPAEPVCLCIQTGGLAFVLAIVSLVSLVSLYSLTRTTTVACLGRGRAADRHVWMCTSDARARRRASVCAGRALRSLCHSPPSMLVVQVVQGAVQVDRAHAGQHCRLARWCAVPSTHAARATSRGRSQARPHAPLPLCDSLPLSPGGRARSAAC